MKRSDLETKNLGELKKVAKQKGVKGYSKYRKSDIQQLINLILEYKSKVKRRSRSKVKKRISKSKVKKRRSKSKVKKRRSRSKVKKRRSKSKKRRSKSKKRRSRSKVKKRRSRSKVKKRRSRSKTMTKYDYMILPGTTKKLSEMKVFELKDYARKSKIKGYSSKPKSELIKMIGNSLNKSPPIKNLEIDLKLPLKDEQIKNLKKKDMMKILKDNGVTIGLPTKKSELKKLLQKNKCSPINNKYCNNGDVCDIRNNICMSPNFKKRGLVKITMDGKEVIGTKKAIENLSKQLNKSSNDIFDVNNNDIIDIIDDDKEIIDFLPEDKIDILPEDKIDILSEDEIDFINDDINNNLQNMDIEKSLEEIEEPEPDDELRNLSIVQKEVLKCLGMYPNVK